MNDALEVRFETSPRRAGIPCPCHGGTNREHHRRRDARTYGLLLAAALFCSVSCTGIRFANEQTDKPLPKDFVNRTILDGTSLFKYHVGELVGHLVLRRPDGTFTRLNRVAPAAPVVEVLKDGTLYRSKVTSKAALQGSYLAFTGSMARDSVAEVTISDAAHAFLPEIPQGVVDAATAAYARRDTNSFFVQGVVLTTITRESWVKIDSDASGVVGSAVGLSGSVYNGQGDFTREHQIAMELLDLFEVGKHIAESPFPEIGSLKRPFEGIPGLAEASSGGNTTFLEEPLRRRLSTLLESDIACVSIAATKLLELVDAGVHDSLRLQQAWDDSVQATHTESVRQSIATMANRFVAPPFGLVNLR